MKLTLAQAKMLVSRAIGIPAATLEQGFGPATEAEIPALLALRRPILTELDYHGLWWDDEAYVRWRFFAASQSVTDGASSFLALRQADGGLLGGVGIDRVEVFVDRQRHLAIRMFDIMVQREYDGRGLGVLINLLALEQYPIGLVVGDNPASQKLLERLFVPLLRLGCQKQLSRSHAFVERYVRSPLLARGAAMALDLGLNAYLWLRQPAGRGVEVERTHAYDDQVDVLSEGLGRRGSTFVHRTGAYLNWRFLANPRADYRCYAARQKGRVRGYAITRLERPRAGESRVGTIVDWLADDDEILPVLLSQAAVGLRSAGAEVVSAWAHSTSAVVAMHKLGFVARPEEHWPFYVYAAQSAVAERLLAAEGWFVTGGDYDVD